MKYTCLVFALTLNIFATIAHAKPFTCEAAYDAGGIGFNFSSEGNVEIGQDISLLIQGLKFKLTRFDDEKGVKFLSAMVAPELGGEETIAVYPLETSMVQISLNKMDNTKTKFTCLPK